MAALTETEYKCSNPKCGSTMKLTEFADLTPQPVVHCVKCRNGFGTQSIGEMIESGRGMFPTGPALHIQ